MVPKARDPLLIRAEEFGLHEPATDSRQGQHNRVSSGAGKLQAVVVKHWVNFAVDNTLHEDCHDPRQRITLSDFRDERRKLNGLVGDDHLRHDVFLTAQHSQQEVRFSIGISHRHGWGEWHLSRPSTWLWPRQKHLLTPRILTDYHHLRAET
jgi:hypothetical protein